MNNPTEISQADRKKYDPLVTVISGTIDDIAKDPLKYWSSVESKAQSTLRSGRRPDGGPLAPVVMSAWNDVLFYAQEQKALYQK